MLQDNVVDVMRLLVVILILSDLSQSWQHYRIEYPAAFLLEVASSMTEVLQGPPEIYEGRGKGPVRCISTPLENEVKKMMGDLLSRRL